MLSYPLLYNGQKVSSIKETEEARQFNKGNVNVIDEIRKDADDFNIIALTLSAKVKADTLGFYSDVTL
jgi:hypothetical protein